VGGLGATTLIEKGPPLFKLNGKVQPNLGHMSKFLAGKWRCCDRPFGTVGSALPVLFWGLTDLFIGSAHAEAFLLWN